VAHDSPLPDPLAQTRARRDALAAEAADLSRRSSRLSGLRGVAFLAAASLAGYGMLRSLPAVGWIVVAILVLAFLAFVIAHGVLIAREASVERRLSVVDRSLERLAGKIPKALDEAPKVPAGHPYALDLDVFGDASVFQLIDETRTEPGTSTLGRWLSAPASPEEIAERQQAVRELAGRTAFREDLAAIGIAAGTRGKAASPLVAWAEAPAVLEGKTTHLLLIAAFVLVPITLLLLVLYSTHGDAVPLLRRAFLVPFALQIIVLIVARAKIEPVIAAAASKEAPFGRYRELFARIEAEPFTAPRLVSLKEAIAGGAEGRSASRELAAFERILGFAELRHSGLVHLLADLFLLWDVFVAVAFERFRARAGGHVQGWFRALGELEALASLGGFAFERPDFAFPAVESGLPRFGAEGLGHPLIPADRRVTNDVELPAPGMGLLVTGSNMSGKSTLMRAMGLAAVLGQAGAPVCARRLSMTPLAVRTSMRISDSLEQGVSHFYAELEKLKAVVDAANGGDPVLFLLDEVLHGTNSRERHIGARAVVVHMLDKGAIGAVTSHDLALADLAEKSGGRVRNVHFEELVAGGRMTFDYKLKPGVVATTNALRLMKLVGIAVALPEAEEAG
jgi:hypothetical protein